MSGASSWLAAALLIAAEAQAVAEPAPQAAEPAPQDADVLVDLAPELGGVFESEQRRRYDDALQRFFGSGVPLVKCQMISESSSFPSVFESAVFFHRRGAFEPGTVVVRTGKRNLDDAVLRAVAEAGPGGDWRKHLKFGPADVLERERSIDATLADVLDQVCDMMLERVHHPILDVAVSAREVHFSHITLAHGRRTGRLVGTIGGDAKRFRDLLHNLADFASAPAAQAGIKEREVLAAAKQLRSALIASGRVPVDLERERRIDSVTVPRKASPIPAKPAPDPTHVPPSR